MRIRAHNSSIGGLRRRLHAADAARGNRRCAASTHPPCDASRAQPLAAIPPLAESRPLRALCVGLLAALGLLVVPALAGARTVEAAKGVKLAKSVAVAKRATFEKYSVQLLNFTVHVGPGERTVCNVIGQLYKPASASKKNPAPAILTTNGFGGSYKSQATLAQEFAENGYVVLAYSGLGFGGSSCRITLDSTQWDGEAASQLVTFLGGGSKATNGTRVNYVEQQRRASNGKRYKYDPVVGMVGGSYGGAVQFAAAADDPRIDTIIPMITWNNLAYSLAPNNSSIAAGSVTYSVPGVTKLDWLEAFWLLGVYDTTPVAPSGGASTCPNFSAQECPADNQLTTQGYPDAATISLIKDSSVAYFMHKIRVPTMLMQGEDDTLFNLHEAVATYDGLRKQHTPVKMVWQSWGHSNGGVALPGELGAGGGIYETTSGHTLSLEGNMILGWFNYYLKHQGAKPALNFSFYRPWVSYKGDAAANAYASAGSYPIGKATNFYLSGTSSLTANKAAAQTGSSSFTTPATASAGSVTEDPIKLTGGQDVPLSDPAGTYAAYESAPLTKNLDVVGIPTVRLVVQAPTSGLSSTPGPAADTLGLYIKLEDIEPNGTAILPDRLSSAVRVPDNSQAFTVYLPGIVHQFNKGDRLKLIIAGSDSSYFLASPNLSVTVSTKSKNPDLLSLPVAGKGSYGAVQLTGK